MRVLLIAACCVLPFAAHADTRYQRSLHDIPWYAAHPAERRATQQFCERDAAYAVMPDCRNAEHAGAGTLGRRYTGLNYMYDPAWWAENPVARDGALLQCQRRAPGDEMMFPFCKAVGASVMMGRR